MDDLTFEEADNDQAVLDIMRSEIDKCRKTLIEYSKHLTKDAGFEKTIENLNAEYV